MTRQRAGQVGFWTSVCPLSEMVKLSKTEVCCCHHRVTSVVSDSVRPHRQQPTRLPRPWDSPGKNTGVGCHFLLQRMKVKSESEAAQSCQTLLDPMDYSPPGSSVHGVFQARGLYGLLNASVAQGSHNNSATGVGRRAAGAGRRNKGGGRGESSSSGTLHDPRSQGPGQPEGTGPQARRNFVLKRIFNIHLEKEEENLLFLGAFHVTVSFHITHTV